MLTQKELCMKFDLLLREPNTIIQKPEEALNLLKLLCDNKVSLKFEKIGSKTCLSCSANLSENQNNITIVDCSHSFHKSCVKSIIHRETKNAPYDENLKNFRCLAPGCQSKIPFEVIKNHIFGAEELKRLQEQHLLALVEKLIEEDKKILIKETDLKTFSCPVCFDEKLIKSDCVTLDCDHRLCRDCLRGVLIDNLKEGKVSEKNRKCPIDTSCQIPLNMPVIQSIYTKEELDKFYDFTLNELPSSNSNEVYVRCPGADCKYIFIYTKGRDDPSPTCIMCKTQFCVEGCEKPHPGYTCEKHQEWLKENGEADNRMQNYVLTNKIKTCNNCRWPVEKNGGCNHMTCRCGNQFCYVCGGTWSSSHKCS